MTKEEKDKVIKLIKEHIKDEDNCRVGWAIREVTKRDSQHHERRKITSAIIRNGRYTKEQSVQFTKDWEIFRNPNYKNRAFHEVFKALLTGVITLAVGIGLWSIDQKAKDREIDQLKTQLKTANEKLNHLISNRPDSTNP